MYRYSYILFVSPPHLFIFLSLKNTHYRTRRMEYLWFMSITDIELNGDAWYYLCILLLSICTCGSH